MKTDVTPVTGRDVAVRFVTFYAWATLRLPLLLASRRAREQLSQRSARLTADIRQLLEGSVAGPDTSEPAPLATKSWSSNHVGDPRRLLHEAAALERAAQDKRREAKRIRAIADEEDAAADRIDKIALEYRQWSAAHGVTE